MITATISACDLIYPESKILTTPTEDTDGNQ
jgi:hypothetical protein